MEIFNLPKGCKVDKNIPKEIIYKNAEADEKFKRILINNVEKIRYEYALTNGNSNIEKYIKDDEKYEEIHFIKIVLKEKGKENVVSKLLHPLIPKSTVLKLEFKEEVIISAATKRIGNNRVSVGEIYNTGWLNKDDEKLKDLEYNKLNSANMKFLYESIVEKIRIINLSKYLKTEESVEKEKIDLLEILNKEIEELKTLRKKTNQTNQVVEIQTKLLKKIGEREKILGR